MIKIRGDLDGDRGNTTILLLTRAVHLLRLKKNNNNNNKNRNKELNAVWISIFDLH